VHLASEAVDGLLRPGELAADLLHRLGGLLPLQVDVPGQGTCHHQPQGVLRPQRGWGCATIEKSKSRVRLEEQISGAVWNPRHQGVL